MRISDLYRVIQTDGSVFQNVHTVALFKLSDARLYARWMGGTVQSAISAENADWYVCICGNEPDRGLFVPCDVNGNQVAHDVWDGNTSTHVPASTTELWDGKHVVCTSCGRILDQSTYDAASDTVAIVGTCTALVTKEH